MTTTGPGTSAARRVRRLNLLFGAVPPVVLLVGAWAHRWMSDDGFIYLRVVQNLVAGHGPVFNAGERVEAATGPLWTLVLALGDVALPVRLEWIAVGFGIALTVTAVVTIMIGSVRLWAAVGETGVFVPLGALVVAVIPAVWDYSTSGLETGLALAWIGLLFLLGSRWATAGPDNRPVPTSLAVSAGLGPLIRPDLVILSVAVIVVLLVWPGPKRWAARVRILGIAVAALLAYEVFRAGYYAALVPNAAFTKESGIARWSQGFRYVRDLSDVYWIWIPAIGVALATIVLLRGLRSLPQRRAAAWAAVFLLAGVGSALYVTRVGGSHMHARLLLPSLVAMAAPAAMIPWRRALAPALVVVPWAVVCVLVLRPPAATPREIARGIVDLRSGFLSVGAHPVTIDQHIAAMGSDLAPARRTRNGRVAVPFGLPGATAYHYGPGVYVFDDFGLGDWFTARLPLDRSKFVDHQKFTGEEWLGARLGIDGHRILPAPVHPSGHQRAAARALRCGDLAELHHAVSAPLTVARFFDNLGDAVALHSLRVPSDPIAAERKFCGRT